MVLDFFMFSSTQLITSYDLPCLSWLRLDDEWLQWTMDLHNAQRYHLKGTAMGDIFVTGAPASYMALQEFFGAVVNCQAQQKLACKFSLMCYSWYGLDELVRTYVS